MHTNNNLTLTDIFAYLNQQLLQTIGKEGDKIDELTLDHFIFVFAQLQDAAENYGDWEVFELADDMIYVATMVAQDVRWKAESVIPGISKVIETRQREGR